MNEFPHENQAIAYKSIKESTMPGVDDRSMNYTSINNAQKISYYVRITKNHISPKSSRDQSKKTN